MITRIEEKLLINNPDKFLEVNKKKLKSLYPKRQIVSIYYDDKNFKSYVDSEEGVLPREKNRIRFYRDIKQYFSLGLAINDLASGEFNIERKTTDFHSKKKKTKKISNSQIPLTMLDSNNFIISPVSAVIYERSYFMFSDGIRVTLDKNLQFAKINKLLKIKNIITTNDKILELKLEDDKRHNYNIRNSLNINTLRYSKYCKSIELLYSII